MCGETKDLFLNWNWKKTFGILDLVLGPKPKWWSNIHKLMLLTLMLPYFQTSFYFNLAKLLDSSLNVKTSFNFNLSFNHQKKCSEGISFININLHFHSLTNIFSWNACYSLSSKCVVYFDQWMCAAQCKAFTGWNYYFCLFSCLSVQKGAKHKLFF